MSRPWAAITLLWSAAFVAATYLSAWDGPPVWPITPLAMRLVDPVKAAGRSE